MQMSSKAGRRTFVIFGLIFLSYSILINFATISTGNFFAGHEAVFIGTTIMCFCLAYLYPQFKENDERSKRIKEKGMFFSYFFILGYMVILIFLFQIDGFMLDGLQTVSLLAALTISTVFISFVVLARRY
ncbi:hypothetical protein [Jeotgalibacillus terrae]|uniref:Permease n=1 Tax=Jeotgalibacillus terrae TaxID=587735 RepID=A0ABW5ZH41_9BACL|nr:hypothetical protein [Jeotgalibacillus terrae]MBM7578670.1 uncharacterized membrane protein YhaH (DUF805 family) [Jeotgalibacillus terrae]